MKNGIMIKVDKKSVKYLKEAILDILRSDVADHVQVKALAVLERGTRIHADISHNVLNGGGSN